MPTAVEGARPSEAVSAATTGMALIPVQRPMRRMGHRLINGPLAVVECAEQLSAEEALLAMMCAPAAAAAAAASRLNAP